jgi:hypothetical protein
MFFPTSKKVALILYFFKISRISEVYGSFGPSSKVKAITFSWVFTLKKARPKTCEVEEKNK